MLGFSAEKVLGLLERVLNDALAHEANGVTVTATPSGFRFETETGASLAFLPRIQVSWQDVGTVFERLKADAEEHGFSQCVTIQEASEEVTVKLKGNEGYFHGKVTAIIDRLRA